jgi:hypothetical protein
MNSIKTIQEIVEGFGPSYQFTELYNKQAEIQQGGNYYLGAFPLMAQVPMVTQMISRITKVFEDCILIGCANFLCIAIPIIFIPFSLFSAAVKQGDYAKLASKANEYLDIFPERISVLSTKAWSFVIEHANKLLLGAMIVSSVALLILGQYIFAITCLSTFAYNALDEAGMVPRKISLFMETYMPGVSSLGGVIGGTFFVRIISGISLAFLAFNPLKWIVFEKVESVAADTFDLKTPPLKDCNAPQEEKRNLSKEEVWKILNLPSDEFGKHFEMNPAHCTKSIIDENSLPVDKNYDQFLTLFDEIDWSSKYHIIKNKLLDDENFLIYLHDQKPNLGNIADKEEKKTYIRTNFDQLMSELAQETTNRDDQTKEKFAAKWVRDQIVELDKVLKDEKRVKGLQRDLEDAMENLAKIIPYINSLKQEAGGIVDFEDCLLKIAIEGGDYCARGIKRMSSEMTQAILYNVLKKAENEVQIFEIKLKQKLFEERVRIVGKKYNEIVSNFPPEVKSDTHLYDLYRLTLSTGFLPLTRQDKNSFSFEHLVSLLQTEVLATLNGFEVRSEMFKTYENKLDSVFKNLSAADFAAHMNHMIASNMSLTEEEKKTIIEFWNEYSLPDLQQRFQNLMLVMLGIYKKKAAAS